MDRLLRKMTYSALLAILGLAGVGGASAATPKLAATWAHALSLDASGTACGTGENDFGQLGDGTAVQRVTPVPVTNLLGSISGIATGQYHTVAVKTDGTVWTWGYNAFGQLGNGNTNDRVTPFSIAGLSAVAVAAGAGGSTRVFTYGG